MLNEKIEAAISDQINYELHSAYLYFGMAAAMEDLSYPGIAHWMRTQANEEMFHAVKLFDYVYSRDGKVSLPAVEKVPSEYANPLVAFEAAYKHEQSVTARFNKWYELCLAEKDHVTGSFLQWFINEQIEEEDSVRTIVDRLKRIIDNPDALYKLDNELSTRALPAYVNLINTEAAGA
mgnify:CR=1 FL=1|jgi:ferritin